MTSHNPRPGNPFADIADLVRGLEGVVRIDGDDLEVTDPGAFRETLVDRLVATSVFGDDPARSAARWVVRAAAPRLGAYPASIQELYMASGRGDYTHRTAPAINVRGLAYDTMRAVYRAAATHDCKIMLFELARSEMGYTEQRPGEYATNALAAAIREGHRGPVFIQGDHYQINAKRYAQEPEAELKAVRELTVEAIGAGYFNIDIDASTIVDLDLPTIEQQQTLNARHTAEMTRVVREHQPAGVTVSVGGEIGEVGLRNSTVEDLDGFMACYQADLAAQSAAAGRELTGISKISVQTGTSHGGIVLPDGSIAAVAVDFGTLAALSDAARERYGMGGAVQHGASTLPESAFGKFAEAGAVEVHLATAFQNRVFDSPALPTALRDEVYAWLDANHAAERKPGMNDTQFHYAARKRAWGPFKAQFWGLPQANRDAIAGELEQVFGEIMRRLGVADSAALVDRFVPPVEVPVPVPAPLRAALRGETVHAVGGREVHEQVEGE